jgi:flagellar basal-body rod protein FlgC
MSYLQAFAISASGMAVEKARVDVTAVNLANVNSARSVDGVPFRPLRVISASATPTFADLLAGHLGGAQIVELQALDTPPRLAYEPGSPDANEKGFVAYPGIQPVAEMMNLITATRVYEANLAALDAEKSMAMRTLQFGG